LITEHFSRPDTETGPVHVTVSVRMQIVTFKVNDL